MSSSSVWCRDLLPTSTADHVDSWLRISSLINHDLKEAVAGPAPVTLKVGVR